MRGHKSQSPQWWLTFKAQCSLVTLVRFEEILKREHVWFLWTETPLILESCTLGGRPHSFHEWTLSTRQRTAWLADSCTMASAISLSRVGLSKSSWTSNFQPPMPNVEGRLKFRQVIDMPALHSVLIPLSFQANRQDLIFFATDSF